MEIIGAATPTPAMHVYIKGSKMRMETTTDGQQMIILVDNAAKTMIIIMGSLGMQQSYQEQDTPTGQAGDIASYHPVVLGDETFDGKLCTVIQYTYSDSSGSMTAKAWIWKQYGFPIKIESTNTMGETTTILYKNVVIGGNIPDSLFEVPAGVTIMGGLPTGMPTGIPRM